MKQCPKCSRVYANDALNFCLDDGEWLVPETSADEPATALLNGADSLHSSETRHEADGAASAVTQKTSEPTPATPVRKSLILLASAFVFLMIGGIGYYYIHYASRAQIDSIAILPFQNESGNPENEYLSDGMTDSLISSLSQIPNLNVKAHSSVFRYKGNESDLHKVAQELNVQAILTGRVAQRGDHLILNLDLVDPKTENVIWTDQYNRKQSDLISLQSEVAKDVSSKLRAKLSGAEQNQIAKSYTADTEAYKLYLQGRFYWNKRTIADLRRSIEYFNQAIEKDPVFALSYAALANSYEILPDYDDTDPHEDVYQKARAAADRALEIDGSLAEAHTALAYVNFNEWKFADAEKEYKSAIQLNPNYPTAHHWYSELLEGVGRLDEAIAEAKNAQELDPLSLIIGVQVADTYISSHQYDQAIDQLRNTIQMDQNFPRAHSELGFIYERKGEFDQAMVEYETAELLAGSQPTEQVRKEFEERRAAYKTAGWKGVWREDIEIALRDKPPYATSEFIASRYAMIGEKDKAFEYLEKAYQERDPRLVYLKLRPSWDSLRDDPRFQDLIKKVGLPE